MKSLKFLRMSLAVGALLVAGSSARAEMITYITSGIFTGGLTPGTPTYTNADGVNITFTSSGLNTVDLTPGASTNVSFGTFDSSSTTNTTASPVTSGFQLNIFQSAPTAGNLTFLGTLSGTLSTTGSDANVTFSAPLSQSILDVFYTIVSNDNNTPGRVNIAPFSTNFGMSTIAGNVRLAVPEPATVALLGLGAPVLMLAFRARKSRATTA